MRSTVLDAYEISLFSDGIGGPSAKPTRSDLSQFAAGEIADNPTDEWNDAAVLRDALSTRAQER